MKHKIEAFDAQGRLKTTSASSGTTALGSGGTGADLSATGPGHVIQASNGAVLSILLHKLDATVDPTVNEDSGDGYGIGSLWINITGDKIWQATDVTVGAAVWHQLDGGGGSAIDIKEDGVSVEATPDTLDFKDQNVEAASIDDVHIYMDLPSLCNGRLCGSTGVPVPATDVSGATSIYFTPFEGDKVSLYDGTRWKKYTFTERSLALTGLIKGVCYDIFLYDNAGTLTLEALAWKKVTATNSPTAGATKTINLADTTGLVAGMEVTVKDGSNSEVTNITTVTASTSIVVDNLVNGYTLPDVYGYPDRATAIDLTNGVYLKNGATTRRYLGTIRIDRATTGQVSFTTSERNIFNAQNRRPFDLVCDDTTDSWTYTTAAFRAANNSKAYGVARVGFVVGLTGARISADSFQVTSNGSSATKMVGIGIDSVLTNSGLLMLVDQGTSAANPCATKIQSAIGIGNHYLQRLEYSQAVGTTTWYGDAGGSPALQSGLQGLIDL